jgi:hypothetical protein
MPVTPFFLGGHIENLLTVPAISSFKFYFLEKTCFFHHLNFNSFRGKQLFPSFEFSPIHLDNKMLITIAFLVYCGNFLYAIFIILNGQNGINLESISRMRAATPRLAVRPVQRWLGGYIKIRLSCIVVEHGRP